MKTRKQPSLDFKSYPVRAASTRRPEFQIWRDFSGEASCRGRAGGRAAAAAAGGAHGDRQLAARPTGAAAPARDAGRPWRAPDCPAGAALSCLLRCCSLHLLTRCSAAGCSNVVHCFDICGCCCSGLCLVAGGVGLHRFRWHVNEPLPRTRTHQSRPCCLSALVFTPGGRGRRHERNVRLPAADRPPGHRQRQPGNSKRKKKDRKERDS